MRTGGVSNAAVTSSLLESVRKLEISFLCNFFKKQ